MLIQHIVVEARVSNRKACKLARIPVAVLATLDRSSDQAKLEEFLIEEPSVSAQVSNQVADLCPDRSVFVDNQRFEVVVDVSIMDVLIEILADSGELRD